MTLYYWEWRFEIRDCWVGVYWDLKKDQEHTDCHVYLCLIPFFPIHWCWRKS